MRKTKQTTEEPQREEEPNMNEELWKEQNEENMEE